MGHPRKQAARAGRLFFLACRTGFAAGIGNGGDTPLAVDADEAEQVSAAVIDLAVTEEVEGRPDHGEVVVDADEGMMDALLDARGAGLRDAGGKVIEGHLDGLAVAHQGERSTGQQRRAHRVGVTVSHAVEESLHRSENGLVFRGRGAEGRAAGSEQKEREDEFRHGGHSNGSR